MTLAKNKIHQGDCVKLLNKLDEGSVDLVFADPPFNIGYEYDVYDDAQQADEYLKWCRKWIKGVHQSLKPDGTFWLAIGDEYAAELKIEAQKVGFHCRSWVIWYYTFGVNCVNGFSRSHTHLFHFVKDKKKFTFNRFNPQIRVKSARQLVYADNRANPNGRLPDNTWITRPQDAPDSFLPDHDTWFFARVAGTFKEREGFHGCQMPEQLLGRIIRASSQPQDLVVDPFGGSGTTLCVAKKLGRQFMGFELSKDYVKYIRKRLQRTNVDDPLEGPKDPIRSAPKTANGRRKKTGLDNETIGGIVSAFEETSEGHSADFLLCDKARNKKFVSRCRALGLDGNPFLWNQWLLRLRKSRKLPKSTQRTNRLTFNDMDGYSYGAEIAFRLLAIDFGKTLDNILCSPDLAKEFDRIAEEYAPGFSPFQYRWAAMAIRKRAKDARRYAAQKFDDWRTGESNLPRAVGLEDCLDEKYETPGVYMISTESDRLYVGETANVRDRIEQVLNNSSWLEMEPTSVIVVPDRSTHRYALQSALVQRENPLLNCRLLQHETELPKPAPASDFALV